MKFMIKWIWFSLSTYSNCKHHTPLIKIHYQIYLVFNNLSGFFESENSALKIELQIKRNCAINSKT